VLANHTHSMPPTVPEILSLPLATVERQSSVLDTVDSGSDNLLASFEQPSEAAIIDVDAFEYEDILK
jgi:hypothetical protein